VRHITSAPVGKRVGARLAAGGNQLREQLTSLEEAVKQLRHGVLFVLDPLGGMAFQAWSITSSGKCMVWSSQGSKSSSERTLRRPGGVGRGPVGANPEIPVGTV